MKRTIPDLRRFPSCLVLALVLAMGAGCSGEARVSRHLTRANRYFEQQQNERAELEYLNVLQINPNHPLALERLGTIYYNQGEVRRAFAVLLKIKEVEPMNADARLKLARLDLILGQVENARAEAVAVLAHQPANEPAILILSEAVATPEHSNDTARRLRQWQQQAGDKAALHVALSALALRQDDLKTAEAELARAQALDPKSSPAHLALANLRWRQGDLTQADSAFQTATALAPGDWMARLKWVEFKLRTGDKDGARKIAEELTRKAPNHQPALFYLARTALADGKYDDGLGFVQRILAADAANPEALLLRAQIRLVKGETNQAISELEILRDRFPRVARFHYELALAYLRGKEPAKASASLAQAITLDPNYDQAILLLAEIDVQRGEFASAVRSLSKLTKRSPKIERAYPLLAEAYRGQGRLDEALAVCQSWKALAPTTPQAAFLTGLILRQQKKDAEARQSFDTAVQLAPNFLMAVDQLVDLDLREKKNPAALDRAERLAAANPKASLPLVLLAKVHMALRASDKAESDLLKALEIDPDSSPASMILAQLYLGSNRRDQALARLQAQVANHPTDTTSLLLIGLIQHAAKEYPKARATYEQVLKLNPKSLQALNNLACLCGENLQDLDAALGYAQQARELAPDDPAVADTLGWVLCQRREYARALPMLRTAAARRPSESEILYHLGTACYMMGDEDAARLALRQACEKEFPGRTTATNRLWVLDCNAQNAGPADVARLKQTLAAQPGDVVALLRMAALAERDRALDQALSFYKTAQESNPKSVLLMIKLARFYAEQLRDPAKALEQGQAAVDLAPDDAEIAHTVGRLAYQAGEYKRAYGLLWNSARKLPDAPEVLYDLALACYSRGRVAEAEQAARHALEENPSFSRAEPAKRFLEWIALCQDPAQVGAAQQRVEQALKADPESVPALMVLALLREQGGQYADAQQIYENRILKRTPEFAPAWRQLAFLYATRNGDDQKALAAGLKAREVFDEDADLAKLLGKAAYRQKDYRQAVELLRQSARKRTKDADLFYHLGMACHALKQTDPARTALQKALDSGLEPGPAQQARRILAELK